MRAQRAAGRSGPSARCGGASPAGPRATKVPLPTRPSRKPSLALHQVLGLERLHQVGGRRQCHGGAHAGLVGAVADQDERLLGDRAAQARFAQQLEAIHLRQVQLGQDQREAPAPAMRQRFSAIAAEDQPGIATHAEDQLAKQVATPGVRVGNQDDGGLFAALMAFLFEPGEPSGTHQA